MRIVDTVLYAIYKEIPFFTPHMPSLMRDFFSKCTNFYIKEHKLYDELLNKMSPKTESLVSNSSEKDGTAPVPILLQTQDLRVSQANKSCIGLI